MFLPLGSLDINKIKEQNIFSLHFCHFFLLPSQQSSVACGVNRFIFHYQSLWIACTVCIYDILTAWKGTLKQHLIHLGARYWQISSHSSNKSLLHAVWMLSVWNLKQQGLCYYFPIIHIWRKCNKTCLWKRAAFKKVCLQQWKTFYLSLYVILTSFSLCLIGMFYTCPGFASKPPSWENEFHISWQELYGAAVLSLRRLFLSCGEKQNDQTASSTTLRRANYHMKHIRSNLITFSS